MAAVVGAVASLVAVGAATIKAIKEAAKS